MGLGFLWIWATIISLLFSGMWFGTREGSMLSWFLGYNPHTLAAIVNIVLVPIAFFVHGIPTLLFFDYPFFSGALSILQWTLRVTFGMGTIYALFQDSRSVTWGLFKG
jgi:hypothetical protein